MGKLKIASLKHLRDKNNRGPIGGLEGTSHNESIEIKMSLRY
jgi:hypothetical protein